MTVMLVIIGVIVAFMIALFFWSRWADREAAYEPEQLSEEEASITGSESPSGPTSQAYRAHDAIRLVPPGLVLP